MPEDFDDNLSPEDQAVFDNLADPDANAKQQYDWQQDMQRETLALLLSDRSFLLQSHELVRPEYFQDEAHRTVCRILFDFWKAQKTTPNRTQVRQELADRLKARPDDVRHRIGTEYEMVVTGFVPNLESRDYYLERIVAFAKEMAMKACMQRTIAKLKEGGDQREKWSSITNDLKQTLLVDRSFDIGLDYFQTAMERYDRRAKQQEIGDVFTTGFEAVDSALSRGGLVRGEVGAFMALSGAGKSLALVTAAIANLNRGRKVLYITLEIDQDAVAERFDAQVANIKTNQGITINNLMARRDDVIKGIHDYVKDYDDQQMLLVKFFASGSLDMASLRAYYSQLVLHGFKADVVCLDYIGEMKDYPGMKTYESRQMLVRDFRGFAGEEQIVGLTALQPNKSGKEHVATGQLLDDEHLGDSYGQVRPLDLLISISQVPDERKCGLGRMYTAKVRDGRSRFVFHVKFDYDTLAITQISQAKYESILKDYRNRAVKLRDNVALEEQAARAGRKPKAKEERIMSQVDSGPPDEEDSAPEVGEGEGLVE